QGAQASRRRDGAERSRRDCRAVQQGQGRSRRCRAGRRDGGAGSHWQGQGRGGRGGSGEEVTVAASSELGLAMKVIVGLGNPGKKYQGTRHNVGFEVLDILARSSGAASPSRRFQAEIAETFEEGEKVLLVKPETFMNLSGLAVRQVVDFYQVPLEQLL